MKGNHEIRFKCNKEFKEHLTQVGKNMLKLNKQDTYQSITDFGLQQLLSKISDPEFLLKVDHNVELNVKRIRFEKEDKNGK